jgi:hypothetical protein
MVLEFIFVDLLVLLRGLLDMSLGVINRSRKSGHVA